MGAPGSAGSDRSCPGAGRECAPVSLAEGDVVTVLIKATEVMLGK